MFEKIEETRTSECGKAIFYALIGFIAGLAAGVILFKGINIFSNNGNNNGCENKTDISADNEKA